MNIRVKALFTIAVIGMLSACKKNDDAPTVKATTQVNVVNASNATINFYQNGTRLNNTTSYYPGGTLGYVPFTAGEQTFQVKNAGPANPNFLFSMPLNLDTEKAYTLYVSGQTAESVFFTEDDFTPDDQYAKLRFVNASGNAGGLVLAFQGRDASNVITTSPLFSNINYKTTTDFASVSAGTLNISVYNPSSSTLSAKKDTVALAAGRVYTLVTYGTVDTLGKQALGTTLIVNQ